MQLRLLATAIACERALNIFDANARSGAYKSITLRLFDWLHKRARDASLSHVLNKPIVIIRA